MVGQYRPNEKSTRTGLKKTEKSDVPNLFPNSKNELHFSTRWSKKIDRSSFETVWRVVRRVPISIFRQLQIVKTKRNPTSVSQRVSIICLEMFSVLVLLTTSLSCILTELVAALYVMISLLTTSNSSFVFVRVFCSGICTVRTKSIKRSLKEENDAVDPSSGTGSIGSCGRAWQAGAP